MLQIDKNDIIDWKFPMSITEGAINEIIDCTAAASAVWTTELEINESVKMIMMIE